jgi:hypothetical protein
MSNSPDPLSRQFLLKQLENEINAGFVLVSAARRAYRQHQITAADDAVKQATETYRRAKAKLSESTSEHVRAITHQLGELCAAIEWLQQISNPDKATGSGSSE